MLASETSNSMTIDDYYSRAIFIVEKELHIRIDRNYPVLKLFNQLDELNKYGEEINKEREKSKRKK